MNNDLISRSALKEEFAKKLWFCNNPASQAETIKSIIDNAPTVEAYTEEDIKQTIKENEERRCGMKEVQTSENAIAQLPMGTMFKGFDLNTDDFMISVYWGGCKDLVKANIEFPKIEDMAQYGDFRHITSEQILKEKPDNVSMVTVIYNDWTTGAVLQYGNYLEGGWVMLGRLYGFA